MADLNLLFLFIIFRQILYLKIAICSLDGTFERAGGRFEHVSYNILN